MKDELKIFVITLFVCLFSALDGAAQTTLEGEWVGSLNLGEKPAFVKVRFKNEQTGATGNIDIPFQRRMNFALSEIETNSSRVRFKLSEQLGATEFEGQIKDGAIGGNVRRGALSGTFQIVRVAQIDRRIYEQFSGLYEFAPNKLVSITNFPPGPVYIDYETGRTGVLFPLSENTLFSGQAFLLPAPIDLKISFIKNAQDEITHLVWLQSGAPAKRARKIKFRREEVTFKNGDVTLSGTLVLPNAKTRHPAIVRIHGAGAATRLTTADEINAYHGIAFLTYDKRGAGKSTGDWRTASVEDLAGDALAGVQLLKSRQDISPKKIGVVGGSEGGWVAPLVASLDKDIAFIGLYAGPALNYADELLNEAEAILRANGFVDDDLKHALDFYQLQIEMIKSGEILTDAGYEKIQAAARKVQNEKWFPYVEPLPKNHWQWKKFAAMITFDPQPIWERTKIPVLALYGELDKNAPAAKNAAALKQALKKAGNRDYTIITFPKANHEFMEAESGFLGEETARLKRFVPGFFSTGRRWVLKRVKSAK